MAVLIFFFSSRRRHTRWPRDWSSDVCSSDLALAATQLNPVFGIGFGQPRQQGSRYRSVNEQGFHGVAGAVAMGLGVNRNGKGLVKIGTGVHVDVTHPIKMLDDRHQIGRAPCTE